MTDPTQNPDPAQNPNPPAQDPAQPVTDTPPQDPPAPPDAPAPEATEPPGVTKPEDEADFYCPGCGRRWNFATECLGPREGGGHPPIEVVSTDELYGDDTDAHTAAPAGG